MRRKTEITSNSKDTIYDSVLVIGDFSKGGFAETSWNDIQNIYEGRDRFPRSHDQSSVGTQPNEPCLLPIKIDDEGYAGSLEFRKRLYLEFSRSNVWGIISCCTARNSALLLDALKPIDIPVLICVDNTVKRSAQPSPSVLQLIPNNALQAQAILGKVGADLPQDTRQHTVHVYCRRPEDEYVRDLWTALEAKAKDSQNRRILLKQVTVGEILSEACSTIKPKNIIVYIGYYDGLDRLLKEVRGKALKLMLCDGCHEPVAQKEMEKSNELWHVAVPSYDPRVYAYQAYISLSEVWRRSCPPRNEGPLEQRVTSLTSRIRSHLENVWSYRFVGVANQSGRHARRHCGKRARRVGGNAPAQRSCRRRPARAAAVY